MGSRFAGTEHQERGGGPTSLHAGRIMDLSHLVVAMSNHQSHTKKVETLREQIKRVRVNLNSNMPLQTLATLLEIAYQPGITPTEIASRLGMTVSAAARNVSLLEQEDWTGKKGLNLLRVERDPLDYKRKLCYLNFKGEETMKQVIGER